jgi:hypothetical protein
MRHRPDSTQTAIVRGLRDAGYRVEIIGRPVDLLIGKGWPVSPYKMPMRWSLLEVKRKSGLRRKDQASQNKFLDETGTPVVSNLTEALNALK